MPATTTLIAQHILENSPIAHRVAESRRWLLESHVDWDAMQRELPDMGYLSGGERRVLEFVLGMAMLDFWSTDPADARAIADALRIGASILDESAAETDAWNVRVAASIATSDD